MKNISVMIVEDSLIVTFHLQATLRNEGFTVTKSFNSAELAIEALAQIKPDIILMDIMLNGPMDGIEAAKIIQTQYGIPVIFLTALTDIDSINRANAIKPAGYLTKPFDDNEVFTVIHAAMKNVSADKINHQK